MNLEFFLKNNKSKQLIGLGIIFVVIIIIIIIRIQMSSVSLVDNNETCQQWATENECKNNPNYMLRQCAKSCDQIN